MRSKKESATEIELSQLSFRLDGDFSDLERLRQLALQVFQRLNVIAYERFENRDLVLQVHLEEGSLKGMVVARGSPEDVHSLISRYSSFDEAVSDLAREGVVVADGVLKESPLDGIARNSKSPKIRKSGGVFTQIERVIEEVKYLQKSRAQGEEQTLELLGGANQLPQSIRIAVQTLFKGLRVVGEQTEIPVDTLEPIPDSPRRQGSRSSREERHHWVVDVISRQRNDSPEVSVKKM